jgi:hypothetical protein
MLRWRRSAAALLALSAWMATDARARPTATPIGAGPAFQPAARWPLAGAASFRGLGDGLEGRLRVHLELFAFKQVIVIPGGIGVSGGRTERYGRILSALWHAPMWTTQAGGVVHLERPGMRLGEFFAIWGRELGPRRLLDFRGPVEVFVNGRLRRGVDVVLHDRDQIVVQVGGYLPPHASFVFPPRLDG